MELTLENQRQAEKNLNAARRQDARVRISENAHASNMGDGEFYAHVQEQIQGLDREISQIDNAGNSIYWTIIILGFFGYILTFVEAFPFLGLPLAVVGTLCLMLVVTMLFFYANIMEPPSVRLNSRIYARIIILLFTHLIGMIPGLGILGTGPATSILVFALVKRSRAKIRKEKVAQKAELGLLIA